MPPSSSLPSFDDAGPRPGEHAGYRVVLGLFFVLAVCVIIIFTVFAAAVRPEDRAWVPELIARYLYMPVVATGILVAIDAYRHERSGWWIYLLMAPVPLVNVVMSAAWLLRWRDSPKRLARWQL